MSVNVRYFAGLRERLGRSEDVLAAEVPPTVADVWRAATGTDAPPTDVLAALNKQYVDLSHPVSDGDEVAFFPPVTGG